MTKRLSDLLEGLGGDVQGAANVEISDVVFDSRQVKPGALFVALKGVHQDGNAFAKQAIDSGARAILTQDPLDIPNAVVVHVPDALGALARVSSRFWDDPSRRLRMIGITGTNGKTTISYLIESIFAAAGLHSGVLGTINYRFKNESIPAPNTTPFSSDIQRFLSRVASNGGEACIMEVSSHALALGRVEGLEFDVGVFTNLTQDHLDFHKTMEAYGAAKAKLFESLGHDAKKTFPKAAVINRDDPWAEKMAAASRVPVLNYRLHAPADVYTKHLTCDARGSHFEFHAPGVHFPVQIGLLGQYNVMNALAAAAVGIQQGLSPDAVRKGLEQLGGVPGRMERVDAGQPFTVVVDYAHTEDALRHVLEALRALHPKKLITVFGCGGDRDRTKRPLMGEAASTLSDQVFVTSDNPRSEDAGRIALDIEVGLRRINAGNYQIVLDREEAIHQALSTAREGDIVLIAGKGHETYQILPDRTIPFDDRAVAREFLKSSSTRS